MAARVLIALLSRWGLRVTLSTAHKALVEVIATVNHALQPSFGRVFAASAQHKAWQALAEATWPLDLAIVGQT